MHVELVTIGDELLLGFTVDSNAAFLARALSEIGVDIVWRTTVGNAPNRSRVPCAQRSTAPAPWSRPVASAQRRTTAPAPRSRQCSDARCTAIPTS